MKQNLLKEMETGSKNALLKKRIITHYIYNGSSTITDLAKELDLSVPTTTKFINEMCEDNYINDYGKLETSSGRHPSLYGLNPESGYFIGVDIKKFAINIGLINFKGDMVEIKMNIPYKFENTQEALEELCALIRNFIKGTEINDKKIMNICINISGRVNPESGYSFSMFNFSERPLADVLNEKIGYPVCIDNDTRAMTYGEHMQECVKGEKDIIFVVAQFIGHTTVVENYDRLKGFDRIENAYKAVIRPEFIKISKSGNLDRYQSAAEEGIVTDVVFRGNRMDITVNINGIEVVGERSLEKDLISVGEKVHVLIYRLYIFDEEKTYLMENSEMQEQDVFYI